MGVSAGLRASESQLRDLRQTARYFSGPSFLICKMGEIPMRRLREVRYLAQGHTAAGTWAPGHELVLPPHPRSFPRPFPLSSSRPGTPTHPAVRSALARFALGVPTGSVEGKNHTWVTCFLFIDSARHDAGHRVRV